MESKYFESIIYIRNKTDNSIISKDRCAIQKIISMYSNTKEPIYKLIIDSISISRNNTFTVKYKCQNCNLEQEITLNLYVRKINKNIVRCGLCKNKDDIKCKDQSEFMKSNSQNINAGTYEKVKSHSLHQHLDKSFLDWEKETDDFKEKYFLYHLTNDDFERVKNKIISINHDKYTNINEWIYNPIYRIYNQTRYTPMLIHKTDECSEKPLYIKFKCDNCDYEFTHRDLEVIKNKYKLLCQDCTLTNKVFCLRKYTLKNGNTILWQSIPERRFIEWCEENKLLIKNGPKIEYYFNEKKHTYKVDFELHDKKLLIEIKDNHCWHKQQLASGKFDAKKTAAINWCLENNYEYHILFPKTIHKFKDSILKSL
jgi:hypothetical protein